MKGNLVLLTLAFAVLAVWALMPHATVSDDEAPAAPPTATPHPLGETAPIVPLIVIKPGETQEMQLSSACARYTRGSGPSVHQLGHFEYNAAESCTVRGVTASFAQPHTVDDYPALVEAGAKSCTLTVTASESAEPGVIDLHLTDSTCSGSCHVNVRVLVVADSSTVPGSEPETSAAAP
jgi:hypothetical protein